MCANHSLRTHLVVGIGVDHRVPVIQRAQGQVDVVPAGVAQLHADDIDAGQPGQFLVRPGVGPGAHAADQDATQGHGVTDPLQMGIT